MTMMGHFRPIGGVRVRSAYARQSRPDAGAVDLNAEVLAIRLIILAVTVDAAERPKYRLIVFIIRGEACDFH